MGSCTIRGDKYNVNEDGIVDAGGEDDSKQDAARRSTSFVNCWRSSQRVSQWEVVQYEATSMMSMRMVVRRMPGVWMIANKMG